MLRWSLFFLALTIIMGLFGFTELAERAESIARTLFFVFLFAFAGTVFYAYKQKNH